MSTIDWLTLFTVIVCLFLAFFFSGTETSLTASSRATMLRLSKDGNQNAKIVARLLEVRARLIGALLVGNNVATIAASTLATSLALGWLGDVGVIYATVVMTVLIIVFCELLPKTAAIDSPDRISLVVARPIDRFVRLLTPVLIAIDWLVRRLLAVLGIRIGESEPILSAREKLRGTVDLFHREGGVEKLDRDMLGGLLDLRDLTVADVMIHRTEVIAVDVSEPPEKVVEAILAAPVTRVPLWREKPENIVGILHAKDLLHALQKVEGDPSRVDVMAIARSPWFVPEIRSVSDQLKAFRRR